MPVYNRFNFRVWDCDKKRMVYNAQNCFEENLVFGIDHFGQFMDNEDFVVMQSTGLVDKNGKEIFEYDIIEREVERFEPHRYEKKKELVRWDYGLTGYYPMNDYTRLCDYHEWEVIGNAYENKEFWKEI